MLPCPRALWSGPEPGRGADRCEMSRPPIAFRRTRPAVRCLSGALLLCMLHRVLQAVHTVATTPGRSGLDNPEHEPTKTTVSGDDLRQTKRENRRGIAPQRGT